MDEKALNQEISKNFINENGCLVRVTSLDAMLLNKLKAHDSIFLMKYIDIMQVFAWVMAYSSESDSKCMACDETGLHAFQNQLARSNDANQLT